MVMHLDEAGRARVRDAVAAAEQRTAGEIRVVLAGRSTGFDAGVGLAAGAVAATGVYAALARAAWGHPDLWDVVLAALAGIAAAVIAGLLAGRAFPARAVRRRAESEFERLGIAKTAGRTGVLLFLSLDEHRAVLLADRAIDEKVERGTWDAIVARLAAAIREGGLARAPDALAAAVAEVGEVLAKHFPRQEGDVNELQDDVEMRS